MYQIPKEQAKAILKDHSPWKITLAYLVPTMGLNLLLNVLMPDYYLALTSMEAETIQTAIAMHGGLGLFLNILVFYFGIIMTFGYKQWALRVAQGEKPPLSSLIAGFGDTSKVIWLSVFKYACIYLWAMMAFFVVFFGVAMIIMFQSTGMMVIMVPLILGLATVWGFWIQLRYCLVEFQLAEQMEKGAWDAMKQGVRRQRIAFEKLVKYYFSYWRWLLVYLATVFGYFALNYFLGGASLSLDMEVGTVTSADSPLAYWISTVVDWLFLLKFLPVFYVGLGLVFEEIKSDEDNLMAQYHKGRQPEG